MEAAELAFLERIRPELRAVRARRPPPLTDTKILTSWNGLMISAFRGRGWPSRARTTCAALATPPMRSCGAHYEGSVLRRTGRHPGLLDDYAFFAAGLLDLYEATGEARRLSMARALHATLAERFAHPDGGFFRTPADHEALLAREKPAYDGAEPTGNSVAALTLLRLAAITGDAAFQEQGERLLRSFGALLAGAPAALGEMLLAVDFLLSPPREVVLVRPAAGSDAALLDVLRPRLAPSQVLVRHEEGTAPATPLAQDRPAQQGRVTAYVCERGACQLPVTSAERLLELL